MKRILLLSLLMVVMLPLMAVGTVGAIIGGVIAAGGAVASSVIQKRAQDKASARQAKAQEQAMDAEKKNQTMQALTEQRAAAEAAQSGMDIPKPGGVRPLSQRKTLGTSKKLGGV